MIQIVVGIVLILLHIICCILVWVGICTHIINVKKYLMFPVVFVPGWGVLCVFILHFKIWIQSDQRKEVGVEKMKVNEEIYKNIFQSGTEQEGNIVPLEEALIVNEPELRRVCGAFETGAYERRRGGCTLCHHCHGRVVERV